MFVSSFELYFITCFSCKMELAREAKHKTICHCILGKHRSTINHDVDGMIQTYYKSIDVTHYVNYLVSKGGIISDKSNTENII